MEIESNTRYDSYNDMHNASINSSNNSSNNSINIDIHRIDDVCLLDIVKDDKNLMIFFSILGFYQYNEHDHILKISISRLWQVSLLTLGGIGFGLRVYNGVFSIYYFFATTLIKIYIY
jgi:hypothetical protein